MMKVKLIINNFDKKLIIANPNKESIVVNNMHLMFLFLFGNFKIDFNKQLYMVSLPYSSQNKTHYNFHLTFATLIGMTQNKASDIEYDE